MNAATLIAILRTGQELDESAINQAAGMLLDESIAVVDKADFLRALSAKNETAGEIAGFVRAFLSHAMRPSLDVRILDCPAIDVCGTGGDKLDLFNVSTTSMFLLAAGGRRLRDLRRQARWHRSQAVDAQPWQ